jgi:hypothetical protein
MVSFASNPQPGGSCTCIYVPLERVVQLHSLPTSFIFIAIYDSQSYSAVILTRLRTGLYYNVVR